MGTVHDYYLAADDLGCVLLCVQYKLHLVGGGIAIYLRSDRNSLAGGELTVHDHGAYAYALLPAGLTYNVEPGAVEKSSENVGDLL